jgi:hypothetical protein
MSIELYGTEALGRLVLRFARGVARRLGISEGLSLLFFLAGAFICILGFTIYDSFALDARLKNHRHTAFQQMVGGLGIGAIQSPKWCLHAFDPRTESICYATAYPVPGSYAYCPYDTTVVTGFGELSKRTHFLVIGVSRGKDDG